MSHIEQIDFVNRVKLQFPDSFKNKKVLEVGSYNINGTVRIFFDAIEQNKTIIVTDPHATRFFWTVEQVLELIFDCLKNAKDAKPFVPEMKAMSIGNLLIAMFRKYSPKKNKYTNFEELPVTKIGLQPGENLHEKILECGKFSNEVQQYSIEEIIELI